MHLNTLYVIIHLLFMKQFGVIETVKFMTWLHKEWTKISVKSE